MKWIDINNTGLMTRDGCFEIRKRNIHFKILAFSPHKFDLSLLGPSEDGKPLGQASIADTGTTKYSISSVHENNKQALALVTIGYPKWSPQKDYEDKPSELADSVDADWLLFNGFLRVKTEEYGYPDLSASFKSAYFCLDETEKGGTGSVVVMFHAYENQLPVRMNRRLADPKNCENVVQTGPRIVEYRAKSGIHDISSAKTRRWLVFAQGNGGASKEQFLAYIIYFANGSSLKEIEEILLGDNIISKYDNKMRFALALTSSNFSNVSILNEEQQPILWREINLPHPVYMAIEPAE
ncbi:hypothetical protein AAFN47_23355 [Hoeflea sp. CAU 1731]